MQIQATNTFALTVEQSFALLTNSDFLAQVAESSHPLSYEVSIEGRHTRTKRLVASVAPVATFTGPEVAIIDEIEWDETNSAERTGTARVEIVGLPVTLVGAVRLSAAGTGSVLQYSGELTVNIPVLGSSLEKKAAPLLLHGLELQQLVADQWTYDSGPIGSDSA